MAADNELRQQCLELIYELLPPDEAEQLRRRIAAEPTVAQAYAEAQRAADLFAAAARLSTEPLRLAPPTDRHAEPALGRSPVAEPATANAALPLRTALDRRRWPNWLLAAAASVLVCLTAGGYWLNRIEPAQIAARHLRLLVTGPAKLEPDATNQFSVQTLSVAGQPLPAQVEYALYNERGEAVVQRQASSDAAGKLVAAIPPGLPVGRQARLEVVAVHDNRLHRATTPLAVDERRLVTQLALDKPLYQPGETVYYRSLTLGRFGLDAAEECAVHFELHDPAGAVVAGCQAEGVTERGVGNGAFALPPDIPGGQFSLVAKSLDGAFPDETRKFFVRQYRVPRLKKDLEFARDSYTLGDAVTADLAVTRAEGGPAAGASLRITATVDGQNVYQTSQSAGPQGTARVEFKLPDQIERGAGQLAIAVDDGGTQETIAKTIPINVGKLDVQFYPEGGDLVPGLASRVYFVGKNPLGEPVSIEGRVVDSAGKEAAKVETFYKGLGAFDFTPQAGQQYQLEVVKPAGVTNRPALPAASDERPIVLSTGAGVFAAGQDLTLEVRSSKAELPLVASAYCRGVQIGSTPLTTAAGANRVTLPLAAEAAGVVRVTVYDYSGQQPRPLAERLVYRRAARRLNVHVAEHSERYSPGEKVELALVVTDEQNRAVPAALGVAVVDDSVIKLADDHTPSLATHFFLTTEIEKPEDLEKADFFLSDDPKAPAALDMLLGTQGWRRFRDGEAPPAGPNEHEEPQLARLAALDGAGSPPAVYDNLAEAQAAYAAELAQVRDERAALLARLGRGIAASGAVVGVAALVLAGARRWQAVRFWAPSLAAAAACVLLAVSWQQGGLPGPPAAVQLAARFRQWHVPPENLAVADAWAELGEAEAFDFAAPDAGRRLQELREWGLARDGAANEEQARHYYLFFDQLRHNRLAAPALIEDMYGVEARLDVGWLDAEAGGGEVAAKRRFGRRAMAAADREVMAKQLAAGGGYGGFGADALGLEAEGLLGGGRYRGGAAELRSARRRMLTAAVNQDESALFERVEELKQRLAQLRFPVRQYAHAHLAGEPGVRSDFAETVYWHPLLVADSDGRAMLSFELPDSVTAFRVQADAHDGRGRIGSGQGEVISRIPFSLEPKIPLEVTAGDRIELPVAVNNDTRTPLTVALSMAATAAGGEELLRAADGEQRELQLAADARGRAFFTLEVVGAKGQAQIEVRGAAGTLADAKRQTLAIVPQGFPVAESYAGRLVGEQQVTVRMPREIVPGSLEVTLAAYPTTLADLQRGTESMLREPTGCFEQASTSNYPNVLSLQYLHEHNVADPELTRRGKDLLQKGYARLAGYECPQQGYEWFGGDPGHEALTAYGLLEFRDMARVYPVDETMLGRTAQWLLARRDGKGGFQRNAKALDSFGGAPDDITNAYIVWALCESGQKSIDAELKSVVATGKKSSDPYLVALAAASAADGGQPSDARELLVKLAQAQAADGHLEGAAGSITRSGGASLAVETTALAALAWLKLPEYHAAAQRAIDWIAAHRDGGGGFGSTQATILALKALVAHAQANKRPVTAGQLIVKRGETVIATAPFGADQHNAISIDGLAGKLEPGENELAISLSGENQMPYTLDVSYRTPRPNSHPDCAIELTTRLSAASVRAGDTVALDARLTNRTEAGQPMTVAILGLPAGLQPRPNQLEELKKAGTIDYYETRAREVICYWRSLAPQRAIDVHLDLVAEWPGKYQGPASRAYLYYTAERKCWTEPVAIEIGAEGP